MFTQIMTKLISLFLAAVSVFATPSAAKKSAALTAPEGAVRVHYGEGACEYYNMFIPEDASGKVNVLLTIHGGAWAMGDETEFNDSCKTAAADYGYAAVTMDYDKLTNNKSAYDMVDEIEAAVSSIKSELEAKGLTAGELILAGHSAGAHIMLMYAYTRYKISPIDIAFVVSNCAPTEFIGDSEAKTTTMGKYAYFALSMLSNQYVSKLNAKEQQSVIESVSPLYMVNAEVPPTIVVQGNADEMVPYQNGLDLYAALQKAGVDTTMITYEGASHFLGKDFTQGNTERAEAFKTFADKYIK